MPRLLTDDKEEIKQIVKRNTRHSKKRPNIHKKLKHQQMKKEIKRNIITKMQIKHPKQLLKMQNLNLTAMKNNYLNILYKNGSVKDFGDLNF